MVMVVAVVAAVVVVVVVLSLSRRPSVIASVVACAAWHLRALLSRVEIMEVLLRQLVVALELR